MKNTTKIMSISILIILISIMTVGAYPTYPKHPIQEKNISSGGSNNGGSVSLVTTLPKYTIYMEDLTPVGYLTTDPMYQYRYYIPVIVNVWEGMTPKPDIKVSITVTQCGWNSEKYIGCSSKNIDKKTNVRGQIIIPVSLDLFVDGKFVDYTDVTASAFLDTQSAHRSIDQIVTND